MPDKDKLFTDLMNFSLSEPDSGSSDQCPPWGSEIFTDICQPVAAPEPEPWPPDPLPRAGAADATTKWSSCSHHTGEKDGQ